jgi:putative ABC transport system permease protein
VKVLKNLNTMKVFSHMGLRKVLLVAQFTLSLFFILTLIVINNQLTLFVNTDHGFNMRSNILVRLNSTSHETLKTELLKYNNITSVSAASHVPAAGTSYGNGFKRALSDPDWTPLGYFLVDENYLNNMDIKLLAGSFFKEQNSESNKNFVIINQQAVKKLQFNSDWEAINQEIILEQDSSRKTIIGVVKDYHHNDLFRAIEPMALMYDPGRFSLLQVAYAGTYDNAVKTIEKAWSTVNPGLKIDYKEVESEINQFYEIFFGDIVSVLGFISVLAILISCLGLLGMATYSTETRVKEISIRKVLGSSSTALVLLLSKGFLTILAVAIALGVPAAYFVNGLWLDMIAYHTTLDVAAISIGVMILILFGVLTVGSQTIRATFINPVKNLKSE